MKTKKRVEIDSFDNFNSKENGIKVEQFYNYLPGKTLKDSYGVNVALFPKNKNSNIYKELNISSAGLESVEGVAYFKQFFPDNGVTTHRLLIYGSDKKVYINQMLDDTYDLFWLYDLSFNNPPITLAFKLNDADAIILTDKEKMVVWETGYSPYNVENAPIITSMCMNEGVLFCTIQEPAFKIWYATDLNFENLINMSKNSGYISLNDDLGYARKVITFNEDVYIFRDYGISKINQVKTEMTVSQVYLSNSKIFTDTVNVCGNVVMFMTNDGLYSFNGVKVSKIKIDLSKYSIDNIHAVASSLSNKYYLALKLNFSDEKQINCENSNHINNAILVVDTIDLSYQIIRGVDVRSLLPVKTDNFEKMLLTFNVENNNKLGEIVKTSTYFDSNLPKFWSSSNINSDYRTKLFTKLTVNADENVKFKLKYDDKEVSFNTYKKGLNIFCFKICCQQLKIEISSSEQSAEVEKVYLDYYEY